MKDLNLMKKCTLQQTNVNEMLFTINKNQKPRKKVFSFIYTLSQTEDNLKTFATKNLIITIFEGVF